MPKLLDPKVKDTEKVEPRKAPPPPVEPSVLPRPYVRWMGWLLLMAMLVVVAGAVTYFVLDEGTTPDTPLAPALSDIDPRVNPEIVLMTPGEAPSIDQIDPRVSPEITRLAAAAVPFDARIGARHLGAADDVRFRGETLPESPVLYAADGRVGARHLTGPDDVRFRGDILP